MTDKELEQLIADIESEELLHAPANLKSDIFERIERKEQAIKAGKRNKKLGFIVYTLEVMAVSAAAVALIMLQPLSKGDLFAEKDNTTWNYEDEELSGQVLEWTGRIVSFGDFMNKGSEEDPGEVK
ncbi:MAG: hypothetical protein K6B44_06340 [Lachnospiraceae bacterium]|nr:hypothetical protein [Lachnospiraceae bacterium]